MGAHTHSQELLAGPPTHLEARHIKYEHQVLALVEASNRAEMLDTRDQAWARSNTVKGKDMCLRV